VGDGRLEAADQPNRSTFLETNNPLGQRYTVTFNEACDLHDAGYSGAKVIDPINGGTIDYYTWTQKMVDDKFLAEMRKLCQTQIPASARIAEKDCEATGGYTSLVAETRYNFVRSQGYHFYRARPNLRGTWTGGGVTMQITQDLRSISGKPQVGDVHGEFRGTLISRDQDSLIEGFAHTSANATFKSINIVVDPDTPDQLRFTGSPISGTLTR